MNMPFTAIYYSNSLASSRMIDYCLRRLSAQVLGCGELITVTWAPVVSLGEHHIRLEWPGRVTSHENLYRQLLAGLDRARNDLIFLCEHDILYPDDYFAEMELAIERHGLVANQNIIHLSPLGFFAADTRCNFLSNIAGTRERIRTMTIAKLGEALAGTLVFAEPQGNEIATARSSHPVVDIRHGYNMTGMREGSYYWRNDPTYGDADVYRAAFGWPSRGAWNGPSILSRTDVLNALIDRYHYRAYLEIGILDPAANFDRIRAVKKESVDPDGPATHRMTSDQFFAALPHEARWDLIFIDGLHVEEQVLRDIQNAMRHLSPAGAIVLHDCSPPTEWHQRPAAEFIPGADWNGTVWRALVRFRQMFPMIAVCTVDADWGCGVIRPGELERRPLGVIPETDFGWPAFERNRTQWLNLISPGAFVQELGKI